MGITINQLDSASAAKLTDEIEIWDSTQPAGSESKKENLQQIFTLSQRNSFGYLEITDGMLVDGLYTLTAPYPSVIQWKVTIPGSGLTMPDASAVGSIPEGFFIRIYFSDSASSAMNIYASGSPGLPVIGNIQNGPFDICFTTNSTVGGTPWVSQPYVSSIGPNYKFGNVTPTTNDIDWSTPVAINQGGTGATTYLAALRNLFGTSPNTQSGTTYTAAAATDAYRTTLLTNASGCTVTINDSSFGVNDYAVYQRANGAGVITFTPGPGVTFYTSPTSSTKIADPNATGKAIVWKSASNTIYIEGALTP